MICDPREKFIGKEGINKKFAESYDVEASHGRNIVQKLQKEEQAQD